MITLDTDKLEGIHKKSCSCESSFYILHKGSDVLPVVCSVIETLGFRDTEGLSDEETRIQIHIRILQFIFNLCSYSNSSSAIPSASASSSSSNDPVPHLFHAILHQCAFSRQSFSE